MNRESTVSPDTPMPKGYGFLKKGNPFMTALCRRKTHDARKPLYVVASRGKQQGLRAPKWIIHQVFAEEKASRERRRDAVERRDAATQDAFEAAILKSFPRIPKQDLTTILKRALRKRSGRVGRTGTLDLDKKAYLAVQAHVRHCHTDYDALTKETRDRDAARRAIRDKVSKLLVEWGGEPAAGKPGDNGDLGSGDEKRGHRKSRAPREAMAGTARRLVARRSSLSKFKPPPNQTRPPRRKELQSQPQPVVIDLTQDDEEDGRAETASAGRASSGDEYGDSSGQESGDGSYELSDAMNSDSDHYEVDSDWLSD